MSISFPTLSLLSSHRLQPIPPYDEAWFPASHGDEIDEEALLVAQEERFAKSLSAIRQTAAPLPIGISQKEDQKQPQTIEDDHDEEESEEEQEEEEEEIDDLNEAIDEEGSEEADVLEDGDLATPEEEEINNTSDLIMVFEIIQLLNW